MASKNGRDKRRAHVYRGPRERPGLKLTGSHHCAECGKWCFASRDDAEATVRQVHPGAVVHYYRCSGWWHYTSMTAAQVGDIRADEAVLPDDQGAWDDPDDWPAEASA